MLIWKPPGILAWAAGVVIGIVDDGLERTHPDLSPNYTATHSFDFNFNDFDPSPDLFDDHGTAVAGVAAAHGNNGVGVSGAAPTAQLAGLRLIAAGTTDAQEAAALAFHLQNIDIYSNSWGPSDDGFTLEAPGPLTQAAIAAATRTRPRRVGEASTPGPRATAWKPTTTPTTTATPTAAT